MNDAGVNALIRHQYSKLLYRYRWLLLFCAVLAPVLLSLGFWQLERASIKAEILSREGQQVEVRDLALAVSIQEERALRQLVGQSLSLRGHYVRERDLLLDNRTRHGKVGYEVVSLFQPVNPDIPAIWVNRGWVVAPDLRTQLPLVVSPRELVTIETLIFKPLPAAFSQEADLEEGWPKRLQWLDLSKLARLFSQAVHEGWLVRLRDHYQAGAFDTDWPPIVNISPEKHRAYALQWFGLAGVLVLGTCIVLVVDRPGRLTEGVQNE